MFRIDVHKKWSWNLYTNFLTPHPEIPQIPYGLSFGKYQKFLNLQELNPSITVEDVKGLTMHEMNQWIWELSQDTELMMPEENGLENGSSGNGVGKASGNGHHGHGEGHN